MDDLKPYESTFHTVESHLISARDRGKWLAICGVMGLSTKLKQEEEKELFRIDDRIAVTHRIQRCNNDSIRELLGEIGNGVYHLYDKDVILEEFNECDHIKEEKEGWRMQGLPDAEGWPALIFRGNGKRLDQFLTDYRGLVDSLNRHSDPYDNLEQLSMEFMGLQVGPGHGACLYIIAPIYYKLENESVTRNGKLTLSLKCHKNLKPSDFMLNTVYSIHDKRVDGFQVGFSKSKALDNHLVECPIRVERKKRFTSVNLYLVYQDRKVRHDWIGVRDRKRATSPSFLKKILAGYLSTHGYRPHDNYKATNISSLEWYVYHLLSVRLPILWIGLKEDWWKDVFKKAGFDETVDFISISNNEVALIECTEIWASKKEIAEKKIQQLLYLKERLYRKGMLTFPILICGENYHQNTHYFDQKIRDDMHFIFYDHLKQVEKEISSISKPSDLVKYSIPKVSIDQ